MNPISRLLQRTALSVKLPIFIAVPPVLILLFAVSMLSIQVHKVLDDEHRTSYQTLLDERSAVLERWLDDAAADISAFSISGNAILGVRDFANSWRPLKGVPPEEYLRQLYITDNPNPKGERDKLITAGDKSPWTLRHKNYHPGFSAYQKARGYYDVFLFDNRGNLVYSVHKEDDFATNFVEGPYTETGLGEAYNTAMELPAGEVYVTDIDAYSPSGDAPAMFMASPVYRSGSIVGVAAIQLPLDRIAAILADSDVLGETGQVYAVDGRNVAMSNSPHQGGHQVLDILPANDLISAALDDQEIYSSSATGLAGQAVVAATDHVELPNGASWGLILEIDRKEALESGQFITMMFAAIGGGVALSVLLMAWLSARSVIRRIGALNSDMHAVADGQYDREIGGRDFKDEIGEIVGTLVQFRADLQQAEIAAQRQKQAQKEQELVVSSLRDGLQRLANGDLREEISTSFPESYEDLRHDFNTAVSQLGTTVDDVVESALSIRSGSQEIGNSSDDLSHRTESQAATLEQTAAALDELTASVRSAADNANSVKDIVSQAKGEAEASGEVVQNAVEAMTEIEGSSTKITQIISVIDDIAFQTNLLALNAGVEAARAGEAGRGFAVVASEVQSLAQRSADAASEIKGLINESKHQVDGGVELVGKAGEALSSIVSRVTHISDLVGEIAESAQEQSTGIAEINIGMGQLDQVTQQNAAMVEEATAASTLLKTDAEKLTDLVSRFKTAASAAVPAVSAAHSDNFASDFSSVAEPSTLHEAPVELATGTGGPSAGGNKIWQDF